MVSLISEITKMTFEEFKLVLDDNSPPENLHRLVIALWYDAKGNWDKSHKITQEIN